MTSASTASMPRAYLFREEPLEVFAVSANGGDRRFREVDEMTSAVLRFPREKLAAFTSSFGAAAHGSYRVVGTRGDLEVSPAYESTEGMKHVLTIGGKKTQKTFPPRDQVAAELLRFSECVISGKEPEASGREGLADVRIIRALYRSAREGRTVTLPPFEKRRRPTLEQEVRRPPVRKPELVRATPPGSG
jgi:predicted dehydrogenase